MPCAVWDMNLQASFYYFNRYQEVLLVIFKICTGLSAWFVHVFNVPRIADLSSFIHEWPLAHLTFCLRFNCGCCFSDLTPTLALILTLRKREWGLNVSPIDLPSDQSTCAQNSHVSDTINSSRERSLNSTTFHKGSTRQQGYETYGLPTTAVWAIFHIIYTLPSIPFAYLLPINFFNDPLLNLYKMIKLQQVDQLIYVHVNYMHVRVIQKEKEKRGRQIDRVTQGQSERVRVTSHREWETEDLHMYACHVPCQLLGKSTDVNAELNINAIFSSIHKHKI